MAKNETIQFSPELESFIEEWKNKPGNLIMILHKVPGNKFIQKSIKVKEIFSEICHKGQRVLAFCLKNK